MNITYDERKRLNNLTKHDLDFNDAHQVLESPFRLDIEMQRNNEKRIQSFAYVLDHLTVLTIVHINEQRIISYRRASKEEREVYHEWLATN